MQSKAALSETLFAILLLNMLHGISIFAATSHLATPVREADAACARCHGTIFNTYLATPMANASGLATEKLHPGTFHHGASSTEYTIDQRNNEAMLSYRSLKSPNAAEEFRLEYFLGSGHLGTTYLYSIGNFLFESPVAWYGTSKSYDMKPGLAELDHVPPPLPMESNCLRCHMSAVQPSDTGTINRYQELAFLHTGITCEACHGDSTAHVNTRGKAAIVNPAKLSADIRDSVCISCHLEGDVSVERAGHSVLDFRPGEPISSFVAFYVKTGSKLTARGVSEVEQLSQSTCKRISGEKMSCTNCHDPHFTPTVSEKAAFFRNKCLACHGRPDFAETHHPENKDCTSCHMPRAGAENIPHVAWTDHRILPRPTEATNSLQGSNGGDFVPIFSPGATARDLAMANYLALLEGDRSREPIAWKQLNENQNLIASDKAALDALGNLSAERGDLKKADQVFHEVLALDPDDLTALSNLGVLLAKEGRLTESISTLQKAFARNQDLPGLSMNLARVQCIAGDGRAARATLNIALVYCPDSEDMRRLQAQINNCGAAAAK